MTIPTYTAEEIDALALMACETVVAQPGKVTAYDVEAYQRISRQTGQPGGFNRNRKERRVSISRPQRHHGQRRAQQGIVFLHEVALLICEATVPALTRCQFVFDRLTPTPWPIKRGVSLCTDSQVIIADGVSPRLRMFFRNAFWVVEARMVLQPAGAIRAAMVINRHPTT